MSGQLVGSNENCCPPGAAPDCNKSWDLHAALQAVNHSGGAPFAGVCDIGYLTGELQNNRPVGVRTGSGPQGHFIILTAYDDESRMVSVQDPQYGPSDIPFDSLCNSSYREFGSWSHTYPIA